MNGIEATKMLVNRYPETKVIILSIHDDENYVQHALKTGTQGYLLKEMDADALIDAVRVVAEGGSYLHPKVTHNLVKEYRRLATDRDSVHAVEIKRPLHLLTRRECEVLQILKTFSNPLLHHFVIFMIFNSFQLILYVYSQQPHT